MIGHLIKLLTNQFMLSLGQGEAFHEPTRTVASLTVNLVRVELSDVGVALELLLGEREPLRVVGVVGTGDVLGH